VLCSPVDEEVKKKKKKKKKKEEKKKKGRKKKTKRRKGRKKRKEEKGGRKDEKEKKESRKRKREKRKKRKKRKRKRRKEKEKNLQGLKSPANAGNLACWLRNQSTFRVHFSCPNILARSTSSAQIKLVHDIHTQQRFYCASSRVHKHFHYQYFSFERLELCLYNESATYYRSKSRPIHYFTNYRTLERVILLSYSHHPHNAV
jgi:hypothetical protein